MNQLENIMKYEAPQLWELEVSVEKGFSGSIDDGKAGMDNMQVEQEQEW